MKQFLLCTLIALASLNASLSQAYDRVTYIHSNGQGTPVAASDELGNLEWRAEYYPFGGEYSQTEIRRENNIGYSGKALDEEIGLIYFGARYYDPQVGRFTSIDPAKVTAQNYYSFNRYSYVNNNPYKYVDPNGEFPFLIPIAIFIAKEVAAELASRATGGATDFLSFRRMGTKAAKSIVKATKGTPSIKQQALDLKKLNNNKNTVTVQSGNKKTHFDLDGATHKGVETPHKQFSHPNTNAKGQTFFNKDRKTVESLSQQDIRTVRKVLERRNKGGG
jgi:RHS repeat-associated protein